VGRRIETAGDRLTFVGALQDVTERKAAEDALNTARADLARVSRVMALGALTASIAHEVNQPLAGVVANAATCLRMVMADPPNLEGAQATAQRLVRDGNRAAEVVQRLRALFANKPPTLEAVDLNEAALEVLTLSSAELQTARVSVHARLEPALPQVRGDRVQLQQVILNLVLNAADAMRSIEDRTREITVTTVCEGRDAVRLSVGDVGVGVDPENVERLFEAFHTTKETGMGVGLAVSRSIIESHEGRLWAEANSGPGATFAFVVPAAPHGLLPPAV
jgi:C4-dicarboxylate-specific signal transduction histidine kinase